MKKILPLFLLVLFFAPVNAKPHKLTEMSDVTPTQYVVKKNNKFALASQNRNELILPFEYDAFIKTSKHVVLKKADKFGLYDPNGEKIILDTIYDSIIEVTPVHYVVEKKGVSKILYFNMRGYAGVSNENYYDVKDLGYKDVYLISAKNSSGKKGILNQNLVVAAPFKFDEIKVIDDNIIKFDDKYDFKKNLCVNFEPRFDNIKKTKRFTKTTGYRVQKGAKTLKTDINGYLEDEINNEFLNANELLQKMNSAMTGGK